MIKGINAFLLLMTVAVSASAGEKNLTIANIDQPAIGQNTVAPPVVREKYEYYEVCGCCERDLLCELKQKCVLWNDGKKYDSVTNWKLKWDYGRSRTPGACTADSFIVTVDITFRMPKWVRPGGAPRSLIEKWETYIKNLLRHEQRHRDIAVEAAQGLTWAVAELPPARTCRELDQEVQAVAREKTDRLVEDQKKYDAATNHGSAQGAVFP